LLGAAGLYPGHHRLDILREIVRVFASYLPVRV